MTGAKKCNMKRYKAGELEGLIGAGRIKYMTVVTNIWSNI